MEKITTTVGLDIAKHDFQVHGINGAGAIVSRRRLRRDDVVGFFRALPPWAVWRGLSNWQRRGAPIERSVEVGCGEGLGEGRRVLVAERRMRPTIMSGLPRSAIRSVSSTPCASR